MMGTAPMLGRISPARAAGTAAQNAEPFAACSPSSFVGFRKLVAATVFLARGLGAEESRAVAALESLPPSAAG
jgi:hypothetical protein